VTFNGLLFNSPGAPTGPFPPAPPIAVSQIAFAKIDSASGQSGGFWSCCAAINTDDRHRVLLSDSRLRRSLTGAVYLGTPQSNMTRVRVDTTGNPTTTVSAVAVNDSVAVDDVVVYRPGEIGFYTLGRGITVRNLVVRRGVNYGLYIDGDNATGSRGIELVSPQPGDLSFTADSNALGGVFILADSVRLSNCVVRGNGTTAAHHGVATNTGHNDVQVTNCDLLNNAGNGVNNADAAAIPNGNQIIATNNYWGDPAGPSGPAGDGVSANVDATNFCTGGTCTNPSFGPTGSGMPPAPAMPPSQRANTRGILRSRRRRRLTQ
jgi:hypothetical protein